MAIFLNNESLILALPLITLCSVYAFFKYVPLIIGGPSILFVCLVFWARSKLRERRSAQSLSAVMVDDTAFQSLTMTKSKKKKVKQSLGKVNKSEKSIKAAEKKVENVLVEDDEDDDVDLSTFANIGKKKKK